MTAASSPSSKALSCAMRILAMRDHGESEIRRKLAAHASAHFEQGDIETTIVYCKEQGWLDDARFAQRYIRGRSGKGYGAQRIMAELLQKGVAKRIVVTALRESAIDWFTLAGVTAERKWGHDLPDDWKEKAKLQRYLLGRGFSHEEIQSIYTGHTSSCLCVDCTQSADHLPE